ncbi:MAG: alpha-amylase family glycosyl hydrolase, partial [Spirochaetia bacterium]|nr:alpha-amylase family glycosyl hydrolase [Spirochaetia bacterium]
MEKTSFYHVWVKSFSDSDGDGCGDLNGVKQKLDYIQNEIGCDGIWLSPIFKCKYKTKTGNMHGYDTTDYYAVNDFFGTEADLISLINAAHERGMKVIFDYVPNHTSSSNDWFKDSVAEQNGKKDWFMWNTTQLNWDNSMGTGHWYNLNGSNKYYYGAFGSGMPDFNFRNYEVREEMKNVARYWLNKGFDGIRVDAARYLIEDDGKYYDTEGSHTWFKELRKELDKYASPKFMMCEVWGPDHEVEESYLGNGTDEFHMTLDFHQGSDCIKSVSYQRNFIKNTLYPNKSETTGFATFMVNHDEYNNRIATTFKGDQKLQKLATALSLLRPTVPIIYYGTEIGLKNTSSGGDSALRGNFDWSLAEEQMTTEKSLLKLNNAINSFRKTHASSFADADVKHLTASITSTAAYIISGKNDNTKFLCVYNLSSKACDSADFTGCNSFSSSSCIMGDTEAPELSLSGTTVSVKKIAPFSFRVYALD